MVLSHDIGITDLLLWECFSLGHLSGLPPDASSFPVFFTLWDNVSFIKHLEKAVLCSILVKLSLGQFFQLVRTDISWVHKSDQNFQIQIKQTTL